MPNLIKRHFLGNQICSALLTPGRAVAVPPLVDDIADALIWLLDDAPIPLRCTYKVVANNLLRVCIINDDHIHPFEAHFRLTMVASTILIHKYFSHEDDAMIEQSVKDYVRLHWGHRISLVPFKSILLDIYNHLMQVSSYYYFFSSLVNLLT